MGVLVTYVRVLGSVELVPVDAQGDTACSVSRSPRMRRLLAALVTRANTVASVDWLAYALWDEAPPGAAPNAIQNLVCRLRPALAETGGSAALVTRPRGYCLELERADLDAWMFEDLLTQAWAAASTPATAAVILDRALGLWGGPAYDEFAQEQFARTDAVRLTELRAAAEEARAAADLRLGRAHAAILRLEPLTRAHPLREGPHAQLIVASYRAGLRTEALEVYRRYREHLREELGLEPSSMLNELQASVLRGDSPYDSAVRDGW
jgi:DNA-binding SARP family transcriptional activator